MRADCRKILASRWPELVPAIENEPLPNPGTVARTDTPQPSLSISGIQLASGYDREAEARLQATRIPAGSREAWVYGFGLGDLPRVLLERHDLLQLHVVLINPAVFRTVAEYVPLAWLDSPRISLELGSGQGHEDVHEPFAVAPACLRLASDGAARLRDLIALELATTFINQRFQGVEVRQRLSNNRARVEADGDVASLFGTRSGQTIWIAGAGPTLSDQYARLSDRRAKGEMLVAVDAALEPLCTAGILPDLVIAADPSEALAPLFAFDLAGLSRTSLVYLPDVSPEVLDRWPGPRLCALAEGAPHHDELSRTLHRGRLHASGSVFHLAVDLAVKMGASQIMLAGADFCFPHRAPSTHVAGSKVERTVDPTAPHLVWVHDGHGARTPTTPNLRGFLRDLERYIRRHPQVQFVSLSRDGARIDGAILEGP